jgi:hypothetical protein
MKANDTNTLRGKKYYSEKKTLKKKKKLGGIKHFDEKYYYKPHSKICRFTKTTHKKNVIKCEKR